MLIEIVGFIAGVAVVLGGAAAFLSLERWRAIGQVYGAKPARRRPGNALIWPSH
ncbi:hypothetical protein [Aestuariivirga sp.]|uniref:hypothetical protein n=1 Tax=Aestuariivirga sp. TaxID=2650926 RepID=UPI0039E6D77E